MAPFITPEELSIAYATLTFTFRTSLTESLAWRKWQLKQIFWMIYGNEPAIAAALHEDLHRHDFESYYADIGSLKTDILEHLAHVEEWAADDIPSAGFLFGTLCKARIRKEPRGVALVMWHGIFPSFLR
jgi:aldehyde dehydrogenase (NAD+)